MRWFKHDTNAHTDAKLDKVLMHYGAHGYVVYWYCLELIAGKVSSQNLSFELEHDAEQIGSRLKIDSVEVTGILTYMVDIGLFESSGERITCLKLFNRLDQSMTNSPALRQLIAEAKKGDMSGDVMTCHERLDKTRLDKTRQEKPTTTSPAKAGNRPPVQEIVDLYHEILPDNPRVVKITDTRRSLIKQRWQTDLKTLDNWRNYFEHVSQSYFLTGRAQPQPGKPVFFADLEWLIRPSNLVKVAEGKYHREVANVR